MHEHPTQHDVLAFLGSIRRTAPWMVQTYLNGGCMALADTLAHVYPVHRVADADGHVWAVIVTRDKGSVPFDIRGRRSDGMVGLSHLTERAIKKQRTQGRAHLEETYELIERMK